jgi:hypothetical protein
MSRRYPLIYLVALIAFAGTLFWQTGRHQPVSLGPAPAEAGTLVLPALAGMWVGAWADTIFGVGGTMQFTIGQDGNFYGANGNIDLNSINPALGVLSGSASGTESAGAISGTFNCTNLGSGNFDITENVTALLQTANASGSGTVGAPLSFGPFTFTGEITDFAMAGTFDFTNPGGGAGVASLIKIIDDVEPSTWTQVKSKYAE